MQEQIGLLWHHKARSKKDFLKFRTSEEFADDKKKSEFMINVKQNMVLS